MPLGSVTKCAKEATGYFLSQSIVAPGPIPRFESSAVDGYGVRTQDIAGASRRSPVQLRVVGEVRAGGRSVEKLAHGCAVKIFTGGIIPDGVEAVLMREDVVEGDSIAVFRPAQPAENIRRAGEEFKIGDTVLAAGSRVTPATHGMLALLGVLDIEVYRKPSVALVITGNEFASTDHPLGPGQIYDCNTPSLLAALKSSGIDQVISFRIADEPEPLRRCLVDATKSHDVIITVGGVSMGDYDYVRPVLTELGIRQEFWQVAMKPGKPNYFGTFVAEDRRRRLVFGLPGNPVSALVSFLVLVKPALQKMMGEAHVDAEVLAVMLTSAVRSEKGRVEFVRGRLHLGTKGFEVTPVARQGSHMLGGLSEANCFIHCPEDRDYLEAGEMVGVQRIEWN